MRRLIYIHLMLVVAAVLCYGYSAIEWISVKPVGLHAFPGSPDWSHTYISAFERYLWTSGMLFGFVVASVPLVLLARGDSGVGTWKAAIPFAATAISALTLVLGYACELRTV